MPSPTQQVFTAETFDRVVPGGPLVDPGMAMASCVGYSPATLAERALVFDGTVVSIGPWTHRPAAATGVSARRAVTFIVHAWFRGSGSGDTVTVDLPQPSGTGPRFDELMRSYEIGTRLLVSGISILGGVPPRYPIAAGCGLTRYYSPERAAEWNTATR